MASMSHARRRLVCALGPLLVAGCLAPTLPLPPPSEPTVTGPDANGLVRLQGSAPAGSWITAYNRDLGEGYFQDVRDGRYDFELPARVGDTIILWYELRGERSLPYEFRVRPSE